MRIIIGMTGASEMRKGSSGFLLSAKKAVILMGSH